MHPQLTKSVKWRDTADSFSSSHNELVEKLKMAEEKVKETERTLRLHEELDRIRAENTRKMAEEEIFRPPKMKPPATKHHARNKSSAFDRGFHAAAPATRKHKAGPVHLSYLPPVPSPTTYAAYERSPEAPRARKPEGSQTGRRPEEDRIRMRTLPVSSDEVYTVPVRAWDGT